MALAIIIDPKSWYLAQLLTMTGLAAILYEWENKRRYWLIGIGLACILATRPPGIFIVFLFLFLIWHEKKHHPPISASLQLIIPLLFSGGALLWFNDARFGNAFDNGYGTALVGPYSDPVRAMGMFHPKHIMSNIYYYFLASVQPVTKGTAHLVFPFLTYRPSGLSFFIVAPFFLTAVGSLKIRQTYTRGLWIIVGISMLFLLTYYHSGWVQFGPRYMLDFFPIIYLLTLTALKGPELSSMHKNIIVISGVVNFYLLFSPYFRP